MLDLYSAGSLSKKKSSYDVVGGNGPRPGARGALLLLWVSRGNYNRVQELVADSRANINYIDV